MNPWFLHRRLDRGHVNLTWLADDGSPQNRTKNGSDSGPGPWQPDDDYGGELSSISVVPHPNPVGSRSRDSLGTCPAARWRALATRGSAGGIGSEDIGWAIFIVDFIKPKRKLMDPPRLPPLEWGGGAPHQLVEPLIYFHPTFTVVSIYQALPTYESDTRTARAPWILPTWNANERRSFLELQLTLAGSVRKNSVRQLDLSGVSLSIMMFIFAPVDSIDCIVDGYT